MSAFAHAMADLAQTAKRHWGWYLALGILLILTGLLALYDSFAASIISILFLGAAILVAGIFQIAAAFGARGAGHILFLLLLGILDVVVGWMLIQHPGIGALTVTLVLAIWLVFSGAFRFVSAFAYRFPQYGWAVLSGVVTFVLGCLLWTQWPVSGLWFIGFAIGLNFIFAGIAWAMFAMRVKNL
ncbi:MAG: DUF308 domain-containing protein [Proteobacteria bacterium]|nr:DUF308 domain-containing protein [Pseudomonadota bacterium]